MGARPNTVPLAAQQEKRERPCSSDHERTEHIAGTNQQPGEWIFTAMAVPVTPKPGVSSPFHPSAGRAALSERRFPFVSAVPFPVREPGKARPGLHTMAQLAACSSASTPFCRDVFLRRGWMRIRPFSWYLTSQRTCTSFSPTHLPAYDGLQIPMKVYRSS